MSTASNHGGFPLVALEAVVSSVNDSNESLDAALWSRNIPLSRVLSDRRIYWFLFDNLNRLDAQLLWVWDFNWRNRKVLPTEGA